MTTDSMEVDPPPGGAAAEAAGDGGGGGGQAQEKTLKVHPLALIGISDHHTRVVTGGSALPPTAPVMGLLFGYQDGLTVSILDAEEMEYSFADSSSDGGGGGFGGGTEEQQAQHRSILRTKIDLHQKVFPTHEVIGWYRVDNNAPADGGTGGPTEEDLRMNTGKMREYNESPLFVLMNAGGGQHHGKASKDADKKPSADSASSTAGQEARERLDRDEQLPLSIYETLIVTTTTASSSSSSAGGGDGGAAAAAAATGTAAAGGASVEAAQPRAVFVNLEFELETFEPERIAVEKVFKTRPSVAAAAAKAEANAAAVASTAAMAEGSGAGGKEPALRARNANVREAEGGGSENAAASSCDGTASAPPPAAPIPATGLDVHLQSMRDSIVSMNDRIEILLDFLRRTQGGEIPPDYNLLRQVDGLVRQLPLVRVGHGGDEGASGGGGGGSSIGREFEVEYDDMLMLSYLAAVAKTARAVQTYSDKFRLVQDGNGRGGDSYMRRAY